MGSFQGLKGKPSFTIKFNKFVPDQEFHGLTKLALNNAVQDPSYLREILARGVFIDAGLPVARATHALVELNARDLGLYVLIEGVNKRFLRQHFTSTKGNLYEGYLQDIDGHLDQDNGKATNQADLKLLADVVSIPNLEERWNRLNALLDVDRFISFVALEMMLGHWDGYANSRNNYRIYHDPSTGRMTFIPHGLDGAFGRAALWPPTSSLVVRGVLEASEGRRRYRESLSELQANVVQVQRLTNWINAASERLSRSARTAAEVRELSRNAEVLRDEVVKRIQELEHLMAAEPQRLVFDANGKAHPERWQPAVLAGKPIIGCTATQLYAKTSSQCIVSWRRRVLLDSGSYAFRCRVRTQGVEFNAPEGGATARISGAKGARYLGGTVEWTALEQQFQVKDDESDLELICEFSADKGEAYFDLQSLEVVRLF